MRALAEIDWEPAEKGARPAAALEFDECTADRSFLRRTWAVADTSARRSVAPLAHEDGSTPPHGLLASARLP